MERELHIPREGAPKEKLEKLEHTLRQHRLPLEETVPLLAMLLTLPLPEAAYAPLALTSQRQKQKTLESILAIMLELAAQRPMLFIVEDVHWIDPSTIELLDLLIAQGPTAAILTILTCRPEFQPPWGFRSHLTPLALQRLRHAQVEAMVDRLTEGKPLPTDIMQQVVSKTDGNPLFVEELTKMVLESGLLRESHDYDAMVEPLPALAIPSTLHDSLMARLDRLGTAKGTAQLGATIGRQFPYALLQALSPLDEATLQSALMRLVEAELLYQQGVPPQATYLFKHALVQDAAYQSLLKSARQQHHQRIAQVVAGQFPETAAINPELLAHHYTQAGLAEQAIAYWQQAGQRAIERSAVVEAIGHFTKGLEVLKTLPSTSEYAQQELALQLALGVSLTMSKGHTTPEVEHVYTRAYELCQQVAESSQRFMALMGLLRFYFVQGRYQQARQLGEQCFTLAEAMQDPALLETAHEKMGSILFFMGEPAAAIGHLERCVAQHRRSLTFDIGAEPAVMSLSRAGFALWMLGYPDRALSRVHEALALAQTLSHPHTLAIALQYAAVLHAARREVPLVQERAEAVMALSREQGFTYWLAGGRLWYGWALAEQGRAEEGIAELRQGLATWRALSAGVGQTHFLARLAEAYQRGAQVEEGLRVLEEALAVVHEHEERYYEAEIYRFKGELLLGVGVGRVEEPEACFYQALDVARQQQAKSLELRAAMSSSLLWQHQGKRAQAHQLLAGIYACFTEGLDTPDLLEAKTLLEALA